MDYGAPFSSPVLLIWQLKEPPFCPQIDFQKLRTPVCSCNYTCILGQKPMPCGNNLNDEAQQRQTR